jgi:hypothetical protein
MRSYNLPDHEIDFVTKTTVLGVFDFRSFLNLAMLVSESERAKLLRQAILDIVVDTINQRTGGGTKYINQRDEDFLHSAFIEENYRKEFTDALKDCVEMGNFKYAVYTDKIYGSIFREKAKEYRKIYCTSRFLHEMENISYHVAAGNIDKDLLHEIITAFLAEEMDYEGLKLKIVNAMSVNDNET